MPPVKDVSYDEVAGIARKKEKSEKVLKSGIFDLNDSDSRKKYEDLYTRQGQMHEGVVDIQLQKDRWLADGRMVIALTWWQPTTMGDRFTPEPIKLCRNVVVQQGD